MDYCLLICLYSDRPDSDECSYSTQQSIYWKDMAKCQKEHKTGTDQAIVFITTCYHTLFLITSHYNICFANCWSTHISAIHLHLDQSLNCKKASAAVGKAVDHCSITALISTLDQYSVLDDKSCKDLRHRIGWGRLLERLIKTLSADWNIQLLIRIWRAMLQKAKVEK